MFDKTDRKIIEKKGLNCLFIEEENKNKKYNELEYIDTEDIFYKDNINFKRSRLLDIKLLQDFGISFSGLPILAIRPDMWDNIYINIINKYRVNTLILSSFLTVYLKKGVYKKKRLESIEFLKDTPFLKQFYLQPQKGFFDDDIWDIKEFKPLECLPELEYLSVSNSEIFVDIDFSKLPRLKEVNLQTVEGNTTLYECNKLERLDSRYHEKDFLSLSKLRRLNYLSLYAGNLTTFIGIDNLTSLNDFRLEVTAKFKTFNGLISNSIETFIFYSERCNVKSLEGIGGLGKVKVILFTGLKKLESIGNLDKCSYIEELEFKKCVLPDDISKIEILNNIKILRLLNCKNLSSISFISKLYNLKKLQIESTVLPDNIDSLGNLSYLESLELIDCKEIKSLAFVSQLSALKYLNFAGNTKILDGTIDFLDELKTRGVCISFNNRKHYTRKIKDVNPALQQALDEVGRISN